MSPLRVNVQLIDLLCKLHIQGFKVKIFMLERASLLFYVPLPERDVDPLQREENGRAMTDKSADMLMKEDKHC